MQKNQLATAYIPVEHDIPSRFRDSLKRVPFTRVDDHSQVYGMALRVGATGSTDNDRALYRLKLKLCFAPSQTTATLPGFFIVENGTFTVYDN